MENINKKLNSGDSIEFPMMELINDETQEIKMKGTIIAVFGKTIRVQFKSHKSNIISIIDLKEYMVSKI
jgi:hypothetical protein